jgi:septum formation protein
MINRSVRRYTARAMNLPRIVLASTSRYRRELLQRLQLPFEVIAPQVDESPRAGEAPRDLALRLAAAKARDVYTRCPDALVIGSDQVAELDGAALGKPVSHADALEQLERMQGKAVVFHTALAVAGPSREALQLDCVPTTVRMRSLPLAALDSYLRTDEPYDCAGAAKIESLGIALVDAVESSDPTALVGLPLIRLTSMLAEAGVAVLPVR